MNRRRPDLMADARSRADDLASEHGGWVSCTGPAWAWAFLVGLECVARWDALRGWFWRGDAHSRWEEAAWRFPGVFDPGLATALGVTVVIQHQLRRA